MCGVREEYMLDPSYCTWYRLPAPSAFMALPRMDTRRQAWLSAGRGSSQWVTAAPSERYDLGDHGGLIFRDVLTGYLGVDSPIFAPLATRATTYAPGRGRQH